MIYQQDDIIKLGKPYKNAKKGICIFSCFISLLNLDINNKKEKKWILSLYELLYKGSKNKEIYYHERILVPFFNSILKNEYFKTYTDFNDVKKDNIGILNISLEYPEEYGHSVVFNGYDKGYIRYVDNGESFKFNGISIGVLEYYLIYQVIQEIYYKNKYILNKFKPTRTEIKECNDIVNMKYNFYLDKVSDNLFNKIYRKLTGKIKGPSNIREDKYVNKNLLDYLSMDITYTIKTNDKKQTLNKLNDTDKLFLETLPIYSYYIWLKYPINSIKKKLTKYYGRDYYNYIIYWLIRGYVIEQKISTTEFRKLFANNSDIDNIIKSLKYIRKNTLVINSSDFSYLIPEKEYNTILRDILLKLNCKVAKKDVYYVLFAGNI